MVMTDIPCPNLWHT